ncbi:MAG: lipid-A-disaccharide synthase [Halioglobus sp.]
MSSKPLRIGILAGESSGDILGSHLLRALRQRFGDIEVRGIGGPLMAAEGLHSLYPMERLSVMGFVEPFKRLPELLRIRGALFRELRDDPPDVFIGIDSPDFTLHLEQKLRRFGVKTVHLVSPSVWAWRKGRIRKIKRAVDLMLCLFPFETAIYRENDVPVAFVGHPLADDIPLESDRQAARDALAVSSSTRLVALLPGSRGSEVRLLAPLFLAVAQKMAAADSNLAFVLPAASDARYRELETLVAQYPNVPVMLTAGQSSRAMVASDAVLLASGTATLEAMLLKRPMVVAYRMAAISWAVISRLVSTPFVALPNVLAGRELVPELLQNQATVTGIIQALEKQLADTKGKADILVEFDRIHRDLRLDFSAQAARAIETLLQEKACE